MKSISNMLSPLDDHCARALVLGVNERPVRWHLAEYEAWHRTGLFCVRKIW